MERFIGVLIEHFAGSFPLWLAPEQARLLTVSDKSEEYGQRVLKQMREAGLRVESDFRSEKLGAKIRDGQMAMVPYMLVVGPRDAEKGTVSVRDRVDGDLGAISLNDCIGRLTNEIANKTVRKTFQTSAGLEGNRPSNEY
jgi:threonyl-tRNA synthetase